MDPIIKARCTQPVTHMPFVSRNGYGDKEYGQDVHLMCYMHEKVTMVKDKTGEEVVSTTTLYLDGMLPITTEDLMRIDGVEHAIITVSRYIGLPGDNGKTVVYL